MHFFGTRRKEIRREMYIEYIFPYIKHRDIIIINPFLLVYTKLGLLFTIIQLFITDNRHTN